MRELVFGSVGGTVGQRSLTGSAQFSTVNLSDGDTASVSAVGTTTITLTAGTAGELVCGGRQLSAHEELAGLLIDDLVVE